jgi:class 3 adenylate cyclase
MGDPESLGRIASLTQPARHDVVVLSADLQDSSVLARRLSTAAFFDLVTKTTSRTDREIVKRGGIVGRHAGDGVIAFFLAEHHGGGSSAARAAIEVATSLAVTIDVAAAASVGAHVPVNVAVHWGNVFMGQLSSEGRLEVTALGDAVNECARIGECARDGAVLASKSVIEQLGTDDAKALGLDPARVVYERLEDLPTVSVKAKRDAGGIAVTRLPTRTPRDPEVDDAAKPVTEWPEAD